MTIRTLGACLTSCLAVLMNAAGAADLTRLPLGDPARRDRAVAVELDAVTDTVRGDRIGPDELGRRLRGVGLVFVGEEHTAQAFHDVQLQVIHALHKDGRPVRIALEMLPWTRQAVLDDWIRGRYTEAEFLAASGWYEAWGYPWGYYREIFLYAREQQLPLVAVNSPRDVVRRVRADGFAALGPDEAARFPPRIAPDSDEHRQLFRAAFSADDALHMAPSAEAGLYRAQLVWDATMGWNALKALEADGRADAAMVVLLGSGHVTYGLGSPRQVAPYARRRMATLVPVPVAGGSGSVQASYADFVWGVVPESAPRFPALGVSLMGSVGKEPGRIIQVQPGSPAARAGLEVGDVLLGAGPATIGAEADLRRQMAEYRWGDVVPLRLRRNGEERDLTVPLRR